MPRKSKTQKKRAKPLTIPVLRSSIEHMNSYCEKLLAQSNVPMKEKAKDFAAEWKRVFGKVLPPKVAEDYIKHMGSMRTYKKSKHTRKHRGGSAGPIAGAPLDHITRPGTDLPYGNFTKYIDRGFWTPQPAILQGCGTQQGVLPQPGMGSNKMNGGGIFDSIGTSMSAALFRPTVAQNPETTQHGLMNSWKGLPSGPGGASYDQAWRYRADTLGPSLVQTPVYQRELNQHGRV